MSGDLSRLTKLKAFRRRIFDKSPHWRNLFLRKLQTWDSGLPKAELLIHLLKLLWRDLRCRLLPGKRKACVLPSPRNGPLLIAQIEGGMGDLVLAARFLRGLCVECDMDFVVEYRARALADFAFGSCKRFLGSAQAPFDISTTRCVARLRIETVVIPEFIRPEAPPALHRTLDRAGVFCRTYQPLISASPFLDGIMGDALAAAGIKRHQVGFVQCGLAYGGEDFLRPDQASVQTWLSAQGLARRQFITINDGWDADFGFLNGRRPTKALPSGTLEQIVQALKINRPDVAVVQIGGCDSGMDIPGVDLNFRGKTSLRESALLLAGALLHIDTEGGLVHLARSVGTPASVFFGPTNPAFFAYDENLALLPAGDCIDCYWTTNTWMAICPLKKSTICMHHHFASAAVDRILTFLAKTEASRMQPALPS